MTFDFFFFTWCGFTELLGPGHPACLLCWGGGGAQGRAGRRGGTLPVSKSTFCLGDSHPSLCCEPEKGSGSLSSRRDGSQSKMGGSWHGGAGVGGWRLLSPCAPGNPRRDKKSQEGGGDRWQRSRQGEQRGLEEGLPSLRNRETEQHLPHMTGAPVYWGPHPQGQELLPPSAPVCFTGKIDPSWVIRVRWEV